MTVTLELKCKVVNAVLQHMQINTYAILLYWERVFQKCSCFEINLVRIYIVSCWKFSISNYCFSVFIILANDDATYSKNCYMYCIYIYWQRFSNTAINVFSFESTLCKGALCLVSNFSLLWVVFEQYLCTKNLKHLNGFWIFTHFVYLIQELEPLKGS